MHLPVRKIPTLKQGFYGTAGAQRVADWKKNATRSGGSDPLGTLVHVFFD